MPQAILSVQPAAWPTARRPPQGDLRRLDVRTGVLQAHVRQAEQRRGCSLAT